MYLVQDSAVVITSSEPGSSNPPPVGSIDLGSSTLLGTVVPSCQVGCGRISTRASSSTISLMPTSVSSATSSPSPGCPVSGGRCTGGAMACSGYSYAQCDHGLWVLQQCAAGTACFQISGVVYCDWASSGVIEDCGTAASKIERQDDGVGFVSGETFTEGHISSDVPSSSSTLLTRIRAGGPSTSSPSSDPPASSAPEPQTSINPSNSAFAAYGDRSDSPISDIMSRGPFPPTKVSIAVQPLNTTHFVAALQAATLNNTPILTDWIFTFHSDYLILGADRGNLSYSNGIYTITSIPIQEPAKNMAVVVRLLGTYTPSTAQGLVSVIGVIGVGAANASVGLLRRAFRIGFGH
jgi:Carbohydrate binding domain (family 19)